MRRTGPYGEQNHLFMQDIKQWIHNNGLWSENITIYGIAQDNIAITPHEKCRYDVCFETTSTFEDGSVHHGLLPSGMYLVFEVPHTVEDVKRFYLSFGDFLEKEKYHFDESRPILERYQFSLVEKGFCEFCIPIL